MIVGIDLGTTNSAVAVFRDGQAQMIPNALGHVLTPSAVSVMPDGQILVGLPARERQVSHPDVSATVFKRYMGTSRETVLGGRRFSAEDLSSLVLASLKRDAEAFLGEPVTEAVVTVPAYFNDRQRRATRRAGELAGLNVSRLINEPTAAALAYGIHRLNDEASFLVFDLGGGTFDVSIVEIFEGIVEVRSSTGDNRLGGEDFNDALAALIASRLPEEIRGKAMPSALSEMLRDQAERVRRALGTSPSVEAVVAWDCHQAAVTVTVADLDEASAGLLERLRDPVVRALRDGGISADHLSEIVLIGGATRMPIVRSMVTRLFGRFPNSSVNPDEAVAIGAAIQAGLKARDAALSEVVLTDVAPFSLGISHSRIADPDREIYENGVFAPIIERNSVVPVSRVESFSSMQRNQRRIEVEVFQGESRNVVDNVSVGMLEVPLRPGPAGKRIDVRFTYDINGMLDVDVVVPDDGTSYNLVIVDKDQMSDEDVAKRRAELAGLKIHPREDAVNAALMSRLERIWETRLGTEREMVGQLIATFSAALSAQEPRRIEQCRKEVSAWIDDAEGETFL